MSYLLAFVLAAVFSAGLVQPAEWLAFKIGAVDRPDEARRIHSRTTARAGGLAIFVSFVIVLLLNFHLTRPLVGMLAGLSIVFALGLIDDIRGLSAAKRLIWQIVAALVALAGGIGIITVTNPLGGTLNLSWGRSLVALGPLRFHITPIANALSILWMVGLINAINLVDGLDGLATGVSGISAFVMFLLAISTRVHQPQVALLAIILAGVCVGFLPFNFFPARVFLGDGGAYFLGLALALLAIYSGAKLATAALVLGFTIIDGVWTVLRRLYRRRSPFVADRLHLHHLLLDAGFSQRRAVLTLYLFALAFGLLALVSGTIAKIISFFILILVVALIQIALWWFASRRTN